jgi:ribonuclease P/MRP protein subunit RPP40
VPPCTYLSLLSFNARSVRNKWTAIKLELAQLDCDVVCISESWVKPDESNWFQLNEYTSFADCRHDRRGGGVLVFVKKCRRPTKATFLADSSSSCNAVSVFFGVRSSPTVVTSVYRPPNASREDTKKIIDYLHSVKDTAYAKLWVVVGYFNLPHINWLRPSLTTKDNLHDVFQQATDSLLLDLAFTSSITSILQCQVLPPIAAVDDHAHHAVLLKCLSSACNNAASFVAPASVFDSVDLNSIDADLAISYLRATDWTYVFRNDSSVDDYVSSFMTVFKDVVFQTCPRKRYRLHGPRQRLPHYIRRLLLKKRRLWKQICDEHSRALFRAACRDVRKAIRLHTSNAELELVNNPSQSAFYKYVNNVLGRSSHPPAQIIDSSGKLVSNSAAISDAFNSEFVKNFAAAPDDLSQHFSQSADTLLNATYLDVYCALLSSPNSSAGPDGIPDKGKGDVMLPSSYRSISLCSTVGKVLERIVRDQVLLIVNQMVPLNRWQHGFTRQRSTISNHIVTENIIADAVNRREPVDVIMFDFSRAFDRVPHGRLLQELDRHGIHGAALMWLKSFLTGRSQRVRCGSLSCEAKVTSGVIQGSVLGPTLFAVYLDSLLTQLSVPAPAFADDLKLLVNLTTHGVAVAQANIDLVLSWSEGMGMPLSLCKLFVCHYGASNPRNDYHCGNSSFQVVDCYMDLGVLRSSDCHFHDHIANVAKKGRRLVGLCRATLQCRNPVFLIRVYMTYIRPTIMYATQIWSPKLRYEVAELEAVQRKLTKLAAGERNRSYGQRLADLDLLSLESCRVLYDLITVYKILHHQLDITPNEAGLIVNSGATRGGGLRLQQQHVISSNIANLFKFRVAHMWNSIPVDIVLCATLQEFKRKLYQWLSDIDQTFYN